MKNILLLFGALLPASVFGAAQAVTVQQDVNHVGTFNTAGVTSYYMGTPITFGNVTFNAVPVYQTVVNIAALRAASIAAVLNGYAVQVTGYYTKNDGGGGVYVWNSTSSATDNGGSVIAPTGVATGRWLLQNFGVINVKQFGAKGDDATDDTTAIQKAFTACAALGGGSVYIPTGIYKTTSAISVLQNVSIYGDGGNVSVISALSCNGLNFDSGSYSIGDTVYRDFGLTGRAGSTANWAAVQCILPSGGTPGVDSRDGLHFLRLRIYDWNQGIILNDVRNFTVNTCKMEKVNNPISLGEYAISGRIISNFLNLAGGDSHSGTADKYGVDFRTNPVEGVEVTQNQIFGFAIDANIANSTYCVFSGNDCYATSYCVKAVTTNSGLTIGSNYFEVGVANSIGVYATGLGSEISNQAVVIGNNFICDSAAVSVSGIVINDSGTTNNFNWLISGNIFQNFTATDVILNNAGNVVVDSNRFKSTSPTNNLQVTSIRANLPVYVTRNRMAKAVAYDAADLTANKLVMYDNIISGTQTLGKGAFDSIVSGTIDATGLVASSVAGVGFQASGAGSDSVGAGSGMQVGAGTTSFIWQLSASGNPNLWVFDGAAWQKRLIVDRTTGKETVVKLNISSIPTSSSGLTSGDVWSNSGVLTIIP